MATAKARQSRERTLARIHSGRNAESAAEALLLEKGYDIIAKNMRLGHLEIDLLARRPGTNVLLVIEVKARRANTHAPEWRVDWRKRRHLIRAAQLLHSRSAFRGMQIQFDVVAVEMDPLQRPQSIRHIQRAFDSALV